MKKIKITKIIQVNENEYDVYVQGEEEQEILVVSSTALVENEILKPQEISSDLYDALIRSNNEATAFNKAVNFLSYRKRSVFEVSSFLTDKHEISRDVAEQIIAKLTEFDYLNDADFITSYVRDAILTTAHGPRKVKEKLENKFGCDSHLIDAIFQKEFTMQKQKEQINKELKKLGRKKYLSHFQASQKMQEKLQVNGHSIGIAQDAIRECADNVEIDSQRIEKLLAKAYQRHAKKVESEYELSQKLVQALASRQVDYSEAISMANTFLSQIKK